MHSVVANPGLFSIWKYEKNSEKTDILKVLLFFRLRTVLMSKYLYLVHFIKDEADFRLNDFIIFSVSCSKQFHLFLITATLTLIILYEELQFLFILFIYLFSLSSSARGFAYFNYICISLGFLVMQNL